MQVGSPRRDSNSHRLRYSLRRRRPRWYGGVEALTGVEPACAPLCRRTPSLSDTTPSSPARDRSLLPTRRMLVYPSTSRWASLAVGGVGGNRTPVLSTERTDEIRQCHCPSGPVLARDYVRVTEPCFVGLNPYCGGVFCCPAQPAAPIRFRRAGDPVGQTSARARAEPKRTLELQAASLGPSS